MAEKTYEVWQSEEDKLIPFATTHVKKFEEVLESYNLGLITVAEMMGMMENVSFNLRDDLRVNDLLKYRE